MTNARGTSAWLDRGRTLDERVDAFVDDLSEAEKSALALADWTPLVERGLQPPRYVDSGTGLRDVDGATAFPAGIALAASFDPGLAELYGAAVGAEARAAGFTVVLGPTLDLARDPRAGRVPEALGEDPYLSGLLGAAHVRGLQANHLIAQVKHYVAYNGEDRRTGYGLGPSRGDAMDVVVSMDVLQDVYLRPFKAAVDAGAWSMMGSYNRINGEYVCESPLLTIPRRQWGWRGFYCPDFLFAVRDDARALAAGLDLGALDGPGGRTPDLLADPVLPPGLVDELISNLVRALIGSGLADDPVPEQGSMPSTPEHRRLALDSAAAGSVLLRNERSALPLGPEVRRLALIGPSGADALYVVGGSAAVMLDADRLVTPAAGLRARGAGAVEVVARQGSLGDVPLPIVPAQAFTLPDGSGPGVLVEFTDSAARSWVEVLPLIDHAVDPTAPSARWPRRWRTRLTSPVSGRHRLSLALGGRATVRLDGETIMVGSREAEQFLHGPFCPLQAVVDLVADRPALLEIDYEEGPAITIPPMGLGPTLRLGWQPPDGLIEDAVAVAAASDAAVVLVTMASGEGMDRDSLALPGDQDELVRRIAAVNPRTIVVLNTPGAVLLPWLDEVAAVLQVWYPGETFGQALAAMIFGDVEPGGRLPVTFPHVREHLPGGDHGSEVVPTTLRYDEDEGIGYRATGVREHGCVFPFGHGLSYARTQGVVDAAQVEEGVLALRFSATNLGDRDGVHVAQIFAELHGAGDRELVGLIRVPVAAHDRAGAETEIPAEAFARWDDAAGRRVPVPGRHLVRVARDALDEGQTVAVSVADGAVTAADLFSG